MGSSVEILDDLPVHATWTRAKLDRLQFPPMCEEDAFDFIDPANVLHSCHLVPSFVAGQQHKAQEVSKCAQSLKDWCLYYVGR
jgi:hypothetical protein